MLEAQEKLDLNLKSVFDKLLGDEDLGYLVLFHFRNQINEELSVIENCLKKCDFNNLFERAHALKGSASIAGAEKLYDNLLAMQYSSRLEDRESCEKLISEFKDKSQSFLNCLNDIEGFNKLYGKEENLSC